MTAIASISICHSGRARDATWASPVPPSTNGAPKDAVPAASTSNGDIRINRAEYERWLTTLEEAA